MISTIQITTSKPSWLKKPFKSIPPFDLPRPLPIRRTAHGALLYSNMWQENRWIGPSPADSHFPLLPNWVHRSTRLSLILIPR